MKKKKVYSNLGADGKPVEIAKKTRKKKTDNPVAKAVQAEKDAKAKAVRKAKSRKADVLEKDRVLFPTFGPLIPDAISSKYYGFLYIVYVSVNGEPERAYAGSKSYHDKKHPWPTYITSGEACQKLIMAAHSLPDVVKVRFEVVDAKQLSKDLMRSAESKLIWATYRAYGKDRCINLRDAHGVSLRTGKMIGQR